MSEVNLDRKIDNLIDEWREAGTRNPVVSRLRHMSDAEVADHLAGYARAEQWLRDQKHACTCYPKGFVSTPRVVKERMKLEHMAAGVHTGNCPLARHVNPMYSRPGDVVPPSYTLQQERRDAEAESLDSRGSASLGRFSQAD